MKQTLTELLNKMFLYLSNMEHPVCELLNSPETEQEVKLQFQSTECMLIDELLELYQWRNGTEISKGTNLDDIQIIPGFHFLSLQDAITAFKIFKTDNRWEPSWFPLFANGGGDFYVIDLDKAAKNQPYIIGFMLGEVEQEVEYQTISTMMKTFCECFRNSVIFKTDEGYLEMNDDQHAAIALQHNPKVQFWNC